MSDDFINQFEPPKPPRPEFTAQLYQRITRPMKTTTRTRVLRAASVPVGMVAVIAVVLFFSPSARAFADTIIQQFGVGGYTFVQGTSEPTVSPEEQATQQALGKPALQTAKDATAAGQLAGFSVLAPSYIPEGYTAENPSEAWLVTNDYNGVTASISYNNPASNDHLRISEQMYQVGTPNTVLSRPDIQELTVRGQPGAWMPAGGGKNLLAWDENGITYMILSNSLPKDEVLKIAESLGK